ncbi:MAG TPA: enoyl-CoA hydratase-related protein [Burkholderiales bacterium]|jgi:enoyl-CoA hydratase/carnithine racemase
MLGTMIALRREGALAVATLVRPPVNAIDEEWLSCLEGVLDRLEGIAVLLLRSEQRAFSAGADLELMRSRFDTPAGRQRMVGFVREMQRVFARLEAAPQVTLAELGGPALGGGLELALACDLRIAAEEARLGLPEARLGLVPGAGGTQRLPRIAGEAVAKRLILGAEVVTGAQAVELNIVQWAVPSAELEARARSIAQDIAALPGAALAEAKACIGAAHGYERELEATATLLAQDATQARVRAFLEKRRPAAPAPAPALRGRSRTARSAARRRPAR